MAKKLMSLQERWAAAARKGSATRSTQGARRAPKDRPAAPAGSLQERWQRAGEKAAATKRAQARQASAAVEAGTPVELEDTEDLEPI